MQSDCSDQYTVLQLWLDLQAGRSNGFTAGIQVRPHGQMSHPLQYLQSKGLGKTSEDLAQHISYAVAYSPVNTSTFGKKLPFYMLEGPQKHLRCRAWKDGSSLLEAVVSQFASRQIAFLCG